MIDRRWGVPTSRGSRIPLASLIQTLAVAGHLNFRHPANAFGVRLTEASRHFVELVLPVSINWTMP